MSKGNVAAGGPNVPAGQQTGGQAQSHQNDNMVSKADVYWAAKPSFGFMDGEGGSTGKKSWTKGQENAPD